MVEINLVFPGRINILSKEHQRTLYYTGLKLPKLH